MDPVNFADALPGVLAQRLVKRLCPVCKIPREATASELERDAALATGMRTLTEDGIDKVLQGLTDIQQVRAACG